MKGNNDYDLKRFPPQGCAPLRKGQRKEEAHRQNISPYRPLPDSPSAVKVKQERVDLGQMNAKLLQKTICIFAEQTFNILITEYNINQIIKNKMKKNFIIYKLVLLLVFPIIISCETEEYNPDLSNSDEFQTKSLPNLNDADRRYIAKYFAMTLALNNSAVSELNNAIHIAYQYGVDEHIFVYDILYQSYSKFLGNSVSLNNIRNVVLSSNLINLCDVANTQYLHNLLFYWPYHDDWDGITMPYVIFEPMLTNSPYVTGYRAIDKVVDSAQFDVSDMDNSKDHFIIIKEAELPYTIYPSFKDGIFTNNGITWIRRTNVTGEFGEICFEDQSAQDKDTLVEASVLFFKSDGNQYDSKIFGGGTEFVFTFATANIDSTGNLQRFEYDMTRKEIDNKETVKIDKVLNADWNKQCPNLYYRLVDDDGGLTVNISIKLAYKSDSISVSFTEKSLDDEIGSGYIDRNTFISKCQSGNNDFILGNNEKIYGKIRLYPPVEI